MNRLVILRGRPGAGKSTIAKQIQEQVTKVKVAIFSPDYFYWQVCPGEGNNHLVNQVLNYAIQKYLKAGYFVILEGILPAEENKELFNWLQSYCKKNNFSLDSYFLEISLEKALSRNKKREKGKEISAQDMRVWYSNAKPREITGETVIKVEGKSPSEIANLIIFSS